MRNPSTYRRFREQTLDAASRLYISFLEKTGGYGILLVAQVGAPALVLQKCYGERYAPTEVKVLEGATFDERSPTWHTLVFTARIGDKETRQEIVLDRVRRTMESSQGDPPLFTLPYVHEGSGVIGLIAMGIIPAAVLGAVAGLPIYGVRQLYFKALEAAARRHGLDAAKYALAKALAPHLATDVHELLLEALCARQKDEDGEPSPIIGGVMVFADFLRTAHRVQVSGFYPSDPPDYQWWRDDRLIATATWNPDRKENASPTDYLFEPTRDLFEWSEPEPTLTPREVEILLTCFSSTKPLP